MKKKGCGRFAPCDIRGDSGRIAAKMNYIRDYTIVIPADAVPNERRAAAFIRDNIALVCGCRLPVVTDNTSASGCEIAVGRTNRENEDGLQLWRSRDHVWEYTVRLVGARMYVTGLGVPATPPEEYRSAYRYVDDGAMATAYAAYHFVEKILGYDFMRGTFITPPYTPDAKMPAEYCYNYTRAKLSDMELPRFDGPSMYMLPVTDELNWNMMSVIFRTAHGKLVVIDGGQAGETEVLISALRRISGLETPTVTAWFITHMHPDHYGVLNKLALGGDRRVRVERIYHGLLERDFYTDITCEKIPGLGTVWGTLTNADRTLGAQVIRLNESDKICVDELCFEVVHTAACVERELLPKMNMNDSSTVLRLCAGGQKILFLSDSEWICNNALLEKHRDMLPADVVQIGHHGCGNVSDKCYEAIGARLALLPAGNRFYYSDGGEGLNSHNTGMIRTLRLMEQTHVPVIDVREMPFCSPLPIDIDNIVKA